MRARFYLVGVIAMGSLVAVTAASKKDPLVGQLKDDLPRCGTFHAHWHGSAFPDQYQMLKVVQIDSHGMSLVKRLAYSAKDPLWNRAERWSTTWAQTGRIDVITPPKGGFGSPSIGLRTRCLGANGAYDLFFSFTVLDSDTANRLGDELRQAVAKYGSR